MLELYKPSSNPSLNDPFMISPKGHKVQIPQARVSEYLKKGFVLVDKFWKPETVETKEDLFREVPQSLRELKEAMSEKMDLLEVTEI